MKNKNNLIIVLSLFLSFFFAKKINASHIPGANITYTCNPNNPLEYTFSLTLFRRCPGTHPSTMSSTYFTFTNDCGLTNPTIPTFNQVGTAIDVNQLCPSVTSNCNGGTQPGILKYTYEATITLPANCNSWHINYSLCCRDISSNVSGSSSENIHTSTILNTSTAPCNNSPSITSAPIPYACTNTPFSYCLTTSDLEGDSIAYRMITPSGVNGLALTHLAGYSINAPLSNFVLDPVTGCFSLNEPNPGNYIVAIVIEEYDVNGNLKSEIIHDFQVMVINCSNTPPVNPTGSIVSFTGDGTQTGNNSIAVCPGESFCFDVVFQDPINSSDIITIVTDGTTLLPGATFTQTGTNPVRGTLCWTATTTATSSIVTFTGEDNACPVKGVTSFGVNIDVSNFNLTIAPNGPITMCVGDPPINLTAQLYNNGIATPSGGAQTYTESTSTSLPLCSNITGGDHIITFDSGIPDASGNVTLSLCIVGDFGESFEEFTVFGEGGANLGTYNKNTAGVAYSDCGTTPICNTISITQAQWNAWNNDGQVVFTIDVNANVNNFCTIGGGSGNSSCITSADVSYLGANHLESTSTALPLCSNTTGGDHIITFDSSVPDASGNVTLTLCLVGDFGESSEEFTVFGEGGANLGTYNENTAGVAYNDCGTTPICNTISITQAQWNAWNNDGQVVFTIDVNANVNNFCTIGGGSGNSSCITSAAISCPVTMGTSYAWTPSVGLSNPTIPTPIATPTATTTYTVEASYDGCTISNTIDFILRTPSTTPTISPMLGTYCPNTTLTLNAGGGTTGTGSNIKWYSNPYGSGTLLGSGANLNVTPTNNSTTYYARREGVCNNTGYDQVTVNLKNYIYALNATTSNTYCTDNAGWHHFFDNDEIILSVKGDLSGAPIGHPEVTIWDNGTWYQQSQGPFTASSCVNGLTPGEERFEMERSWNLNFNGGTLNPPYNVRFYYETGEKTAVENAAANWMTTHSTCGYNYKYATPLGVYWFKNTGTNYTAPDYDGTHLTGTTGTTNNGIHYEELSGINNFSGGSLGITLVPNSFLPIQWLYFNGETSEKINHLNWATDSEQNTDYFNIQRSRDGFDFQTIGSTAAQGNSNSTKHYAFQDKTPFEGFNYYRLELVELDGKTAFSNTISLTLPLNQLGYSFYPNPTEELVYYHYEASKKETLKIEIFNLLGKQISVSTSISNLGNNNIPINLSNYPNGTYIIHVHNKNNGQVHSSQIIKIK